MLNWLTLACFPHYLQPIKASPPFFSGSYVFLMDSGMEIFIWRGANATLSSTTKARWDTHNLLEPAEVSDLNEVKLELFQALMCC